MKTEVLKLTGGDSDREIIERAARVIDAGGLVVFPTETVYGIGCGARKDAVERLNRVKSRENLKRYTLHIGDKQRCRQYVPKVPLRARKLIDAYWPGPLTLVFEIEPGLMHIQQGFVPEEQYELLYKDNSIGIRCVEHSGGRELLNRTRLPVFAPSANPAGEAPAISAAQALDYLDGQVDLILDGGLCEYRQSSTVVQIDGREVNILREGAIAREDIKETAMVRILFVCTGNTCRSPMAEILMRHILSEKLNCRIDELDAKGYKIASAGVAAMAGMPASQEIVEICARKDIDATSHRSRVLTKEDIEESDFVFAMSSGHKAHIRDSISTSANKVQLLDDNGDISDPIGQGMNVYNECARQIERALLSKLDRILE